MRGMARARSQAIILDGTRAVMAASKPEASATSPAPCARESDARKFRMVVPFVFRLTPLLTLALVRCPWLNLSDAPLSSTEIEPASLRISEEIRGESGWERHKPARAV